MNLAHYLQPEESQPRLDFLAHFHIFSHENPNLLNEIICSDEDSITMES